MTNDERGCNSRQGEGVSFTLRWVTFAIGRVSWRYPNIKTNINTYQAGIRRTLDPRA